MLQKSNAIIVTFTLKQNKIKPTSEMLVSATLDLQHRRITWQWWYWSLKK